MDHHICGVLTGTLPQVSQQNLFLGLPLQLLPEEAAVLLAHNLAVVVDDVHTHREPSVEQAAVYADRRLREVKLQQEAHIQQAREKQAQMQAKYGDQIQRKREEKAERRRKAAELNLVHEIMGGDSPSPPLPEGTATSAVQGSTSSQEEANIQPEQSKTHTAITTTSQPSTLDSDQTSPKTGSLPNIPFSIVNETVSSSSSHPWYVPISRAAPQHFPSSIFTEPRASASIFPFPSASSSMQIARFRVFEDLWLRGYYMGKGLKFGGDYLCYPGDPLRFHSHFTATVLESPQQGILPLDIVSWGRLATAVKKASLLAAWDSKTEKVVYISLEWAGFG